MNVKQFLRIKRADTIGEQFGGGISNIITNKLLGSTLLPSESLSSAVGSLAAYKAPAATIQELKEYNATPAVGIIPGVSAYRAIRRRKATERLLKDPKQNNNSMIWHEEVAPFTHELGAAALGGAAAYAYYKSKPKQELINRFRNSKLFKNPKTNKNIIKFIEKHPALILGSKGIIYGGTAMMGLNALSSGLGFLGETPDTEERSKYLNNKDNILKSYLIPGYARYQSTRNTRYTDRFK